ncbi:MAG: nitroreductase family protein [Firmicutes bacterium]|nr:nitroreductase family protein [Bacillota bacterium]
MNILDAIYQRHSIRKYKVQDVPTEDIKEIIKAATYAPSGKNSQNWHFVVVKNKDKIERIAQIIEEKNEAIAKKIKDEDRKKSFTKFLKFTTHFRNAQVLILVYAGEYPVTGYNELLESGVPHEKTHELLLKPSPGIQNIGASIQNLMLAATSMGYGTCWMTSQNYAAEEITDYIGFDKEGYFLATITPLGVPEGEVKSPPRKPVEEVLTIVE